MIFTRVQATATISTTAVALVLVAHIIGIGIGRTIVQIVIVLVAVPVGMPPNLVPLLRLVSLLVIGVLLGFEDHFSYFFLLLFKIEQFLLEIEDRAVQVV